MALPFEKFASLLLVVAFAPLPLLGLVYFVRKPSRRFFWSSLVLFLPAALIVSLFFITKVQDEVPLGDTIGLVYFSSLQVLCSCILSIVLGAFCVKAHRSVLLWMAPATLVVAAVSFTLIRVYLQ